MERSVRRTNAAVRAIARWHRDCGASTAMTRLTPLALIVLLAGCGSEAPPLACGPGTVQIGGQCVVETVANDGGEVFEADAGAPIGDAGAPAEAYDAGGWWTGTEPPPGCDEASGECDAWELELLTALRAGCAGLAVDPALQAISDEHSSYMAGVDRLSATGGRGTIFDQLADHGIDYSDAAALFSMTRDGAEDVLSRWRTNADSGAILSGCYTHAGVSFETSATGATYATVVLVTR
jgi:hypothetical protein